MSDTTKLSKSFIENGKDLNLDEATTLLVEAEKRLKQIKEEREADQKLSAAKQIVKDLSGGYTSAASYEKAKISFLLDKIQEIESGDINPTSGLNQE